MNYGKKSLENLYSGIAGKPVQPRKHLNILGEEVQINVSGEREGNYNITTAYFDKVVNPMMHTSKADNHRLHEIIFKRGVESDMFREDQSLYNETAERLFEYISNSTDLSKFCERIDDRDFLTKAGNLFLERLKTTTEFDYLDLLNELYDGQFTYDKYLIDKIRPASTFGQTRGAGGPGECFFAFFFNGTKPKVGDIEINNHGIELKKQGGRVGKNITIDDGKRLREFIEDRASVINYVKEQGGNTISDLFNGIKEWGGFTGTHIKINNGFFNRPIEDVMSVNSLFLSQLIGTFHIKQYKEKVGAFEYVQIFEGTRTIGFDSSVIDMDPFDMIKYLNDKKISFKYHSDKGSMFDGSGVTINMLKNTRATPGRVADVSSSLGSLGS